MRLNWWLVKLTASLWCFIILIPPAEAPVWDPFWSWWSWCQQVKTAFLIRMEILEIICPWVRTLIESQNSNLSKKEILKMGERAALLGYWVINKSCSVSQSGFLSGFQDEFLMLWHLSGGSVNGTACQIRVFIIFNSCKLYFKVYECKELELRVGLDHSFSQKYKCIPMKKQTYQKYWRNLKFLQKKCKSFGW